MSNAPFPLRYADRGLAGPCTHQLEEFTKRAAICKAEEFASGKISGEASMED
jgi:hypothetical protein